MLKTLVLKELRETAWLALVAFAAQMVFVAGCCGYPIVPLFRVTRPGQVPFLTDGFVNIFTFISVALAIVLGLRQTVVESHRGTWLFLLHRPISLRRILAVKLAVGLAVYLLCGALVIVIYGAWASLSGRHASPFYWWMTADAWAVWFAIATVYLGAFLAGLRPARWFGTRLLPLAGSGIFAVIVGAACYYGAWLGVLPALFTAACLIGLTLFTARTRDFS